MPEMTVAENLFLGHLPARFGVVNRSQLRQRALACLKGLADEIDLAALFRALWKQKLLIVSVTLLVGMLVGMGRSPKVQQRHWR